MKRLTTRVHGKSSLVKGMSIFDIEEAIDHLVTIEDILGDEYDLDRLRELVEADQEKRCVIFRKGYGVVSEYEVDEEGFITRTATGVVTREEYDRVLKGEAYGG